MVDLKIASILLYKRRDNIAILLFLQRGITIYQFFLLEIACLKNIHFIHIIHIHEWITYVNLFFSMKMHFKTWLCLHNILLSTI